MVILALNLTYMQKVDDMKESDLKDVEAKYKIRC